MKNMKKVLEGIYSNPELRKKVIPLFLGNPGLGKSVIVQEFVKEKGVKMVELIASQVSPFEVSGICIPDKESQQMKYYNFDNLESLEDGDILFFDEILNGNPVVLNACLTLLEQRRFISGKPLPNIMIIAAANPQGAVPLTPQVKERFVWYDVTFDRDMWSDYMKKKYKMPKEMLQKLSNIVKEEDFSTARNYMTPRSVDKAVAMMIKGLPTPYEFVLDPILSQLITNNLEEAVDLPNGNKLEPNEKIMWLNMYKK